MSKANKAVGGVVAGALVVAITVLAGPESPLLQVVSILGSSLGIGVGVYVTPKNAE